MNEERVMLAKAVWNLTTEEQKSIFREYNQELHNLPDMTFEEADTKIEHLTVIYEKKAEKVGLDADLFEAVDTAYSILFLE